MSEVKGRKGTKLINKNPEEYKQKEDMADTYAVKQVTAQTVLKAAKVVVLVMSREGKPYMLSRRVQQKPP